MKSSKSSAKRSKSPIPRSPKGSSGSSRVNRKKQMELMEAAAAGTAPTLTLDIGGSGEPKPATTTTTGSRSTSPKHQLSLPLLPEQEPPKMESSSTFERTAVVAGDFLSSLSSSRSLQAASAETPGRAQRSQSTSIPSSHSTFFSQRDKYEVDQSINLMDASSKRYSVSDLPEPNHSRTSSSKNQKGPSTSFVDVFFGGTGSTSGSFVSGRTRSGSGVAVDVSSSSARKEKNNVKTSWKTSMGGRILIGLIFLAFVTLVTLSVTFFVKQSPDEDNTNSNSKDDKETEQVNLIRTSPPTLEDVEVVVSRPDRVSFETNFAGSGPPAFAIFDYDNMVENTARFEDLKWALLDNKGDSVLSEGRLEDTTGSAFHALRWLTDDDEMQMKPDDPGLSTRFAMASLFYATHHVVTQTNTQRQALKLTNSENDEASRTTKWVRENRWMTGSGVCEWYGLDCENVQGGSGNVDVVHLNLTSNGLRGTIPEELDLLSKLVLLDLSSNALSGTIPSSLVGCLTHMKYLLLEKNSLSGPIPDNFQRMFDAFEIYLSHNQLTGPMPESFKHIDNLRALYVGHNKLTGGINPITELQDINHLHLEYNEFDGTLPTMIRKLLKLNDLRLENNKLTGRLPEEFAANTRLRLLYLGNNKLTGGIPEMFQELHRLTDLQLHGNNLKSGLPTSMGALTSLRRFTLEGNVVTGHLPSEWGMMTDLEALDLFRNEIVGSIPTEFGDMSNLRDLSLGHNFLRHTIPSELGQLTRLKILDLKRNAIKGTVPTELGNLESLVKLELGDTMVTGTMPEEICELNHLKDLEADCKSEIECYCCSKCS